MIAERLIIEALFPPAPSGVPVRPHVRRRPSNPKREAVHDALRAALAGGKR